MRAALGQIPRAKAQDVSPSQPKQCGMAVNEIWGMEFVGNLK